MKILVVGAGEQGRACLWDLARQRGPNRLGAADRDDRALERIRREPWAREIRTHVLDVSDVRACASLMGDYDAVVSAVPYLFNAGLTRAAVEAGCHLVDMGGNTDVVLEQRTLDEAARQAGVSILPDGGLAPGLAVVLAGFLAREESPHEIRLRVGGLPQNPRPPLDYQLTFSAHGLLNEYAGQALALRAGRVTRLPVLEEEEAVEFSGPEPLEAALTSGGSSTLAYTFAGRVSELDYKTIRYRGHFAKVRLLRDLGLLEDRSLLLPPPEGDRPVPVSLRQVMARLLEERLRQPEVRDRVLLRVWSRAQDRGGERTRIFELHDLYDADTGLSAMQRSTAFPVAVEALLLAEGALPAGVLRQETDVPALHLIAELRRRGIDIRERVERD